MLALPACVGTCTLLHCSIAVFKLLNRKNIGNDSGEMPIGGMQKVRWVVMHRQTANGAVIRRLKLATVARVICDICYYSNSDIVDGSWTELQTLVTSKFRVTFVAVAAAPTTSCVFDCRWASRKRNAQRADTTRPECLTRTFRKD